MIDWNTYYVDPRHEAMLNASQPTPTPDERAVAPELVSRLVALTKLLSDNRYTGFDWHEDAIEIVAALEPVDEDLARARKIVSARYKGPMTLVEILEGRMFVEDCEDVTTGIKLGRQLEKEGK